MNHSPRRILLLVLMLLSLLAVTAGCAQGEAHLRIKANGTGDLSLTMALNSKALTALGGGDVMAKISEKLAESGFAVDPLSTDNGQAKLHATRSIDFKKGTDVQVPGVTVTRETSKGGPFTTDEHVMIDADLSKLMPERVRSEVTDRLADLNPLVRKLVLRELQFDFKLTMPLRAKAHNADAVEDGGKTLVWHLSLTEPDKFDVTVGVPNVKVIAITAAAALLVIGALIAWWRIHRRNRRG
ncbi:hypothetical protein PaecuDRAFT_2754 [Paenibacillus curdlanolyticus YK9]|uniref:DUF3153 domain-containing protein n=1 Tax=Paenibacillus curdlanolyticus YK9 TaxID=717606 RepID=E0IB27_9BACL|nr:hypothetical protein [Paenibacillus curdlanolyticus]EFM10318.1 hypothetical protein PaecuDRAFT_2754 [Paenibacillus curdlanolyticus YK9]